VLPDRIAAFFFSVAAADVYSLELEYVFGLKVGASLARVVGRFKPP
jgi:hypothetical protein